MDLSTFSHNLEFRKGIWYSKRLSEISYPKEGNETCYQLEENSFWFRHRNNCIGALVKRFHTGSFFFDIGGGNGFVTQHLQKEGIESVLLEPGEAGVNYALKRGIKNVVCATLEDSGMKKRSIPSAGLFDVLEHIENDLMFLKNIHEYLLPGGHVFISVPAYKILWSHEDEIAGHYKRYTLKSLNEVLNKAGFKSVFGTYFFSVLPLPIFMFRTLPDKFRHHKEKMEAEKYKRDHAVKNGAFGKVMNSIWAWELLRIKQLKKIVFGGSILVAAVRN